jgi:RNA recognition motif-containing protein
VEVRLIPTKRDIAFVEYADEASSTVAKDALHNFKIDGETKMKVSQLVSSDRLNCLLDYMLISLGLCEIGHFREKIKDEVDGLVRFVLFRRYRLSCTYTHDMVNTECRGV